jgi:Ca-activated chloride channel family protein
VKVALLVTLSLIGTAGVSGQTSTSTFRSSVDVVALNVVVVDKQQRFVSGLTAGNFNVYEDGVQQDVSFFAAGAAPLDLAILLDTSASMLEKLATAQQAASGLASVLRPVDRLMVMDVKDSSQIIAPLSSDFEAARTAIRSTSARGGTALYNGVYLTLREMTKQQKSESDIRRQALVLLSDGDDTTSLVSFDDVMELAKESGISIYTIMLRAAPIRDHHGVPGRFSQSDFGMKTLAQETGARSFFPREVGELGDVYKSIGQELASQYALGYTSNNTRRDGAYRRVAVRIVDRAGALPRTRAGYIAPRG